WNIHRPIPFDSHERTGNDQANRTIGIRDLSDDAYAPRDHFLNPLPKEGAKLLNLYLRIRLSSWFFAVREIMQILRESILTLVLLGAVPALAQAPALNATTPESTAGQ